MLCLSSSAMVETPLVRHESKIKTIVEKSFLAIDPRVIFTSRPLLPAIKKKFCLLQFIIFRATVIVGA